MYSASFFTRSRRVAVFCDRFGMNRDMYVAMPRNPGVVRGFAVLSFTGCLRLCLGLNVRRLR